MSDYKEQIPKSISTHPGSHNSYLVCLGTVGISGWIIVAEVPPVWQVCKRRKSH